MPKTKTIAKTADELTVGDRVKFGTNDFRTIVKIEAKWNTRYVHVDAGDRGRATDSGGAYRCFEINSRKWRVAA